VWPTLPAIRSTRAALIAALAVLSFALMSAWISQRAHVTPAVGREIYGWVVTHRRHWSIGLARIVRWGGITDVGLAALAATGTIAAPGRELASRARTGLLLALIAASESYVEIRINHLIGRLRPRMPRCSPCPAHGS
jgi:hypothetical protein